MNRILKLAEKPLMERVRLCRGPFEEHPEFYTPNPNSNSGSHGSMKLSFSILQQNAGVLVFTYDDDDSDEFRPTFKHHFDLTNARFFGWSPLGSSFLCDTDKELSVIHIEPSYQEMNLKFPIDKKVAFAGFSPQDNFIYVLFRLSHDIPSKYQLDIIEASTGRLGKTFKLTFDNLSSKLELETILKWDNNDTYLALLSNRMVRIFDTKTFSVVRRFKNMLYYGFAPSGSIVALFDQNSVKFVKVTSGKELQNKVMVNRVNYYKDCWESGGDYLACACYGIDFKNIFLMSLKSGMSEFITVPSCEYICLGWKGNGKEFAALYCGTDGELNFYTIQEDGLTLSPKLIKTEKALKAGFLHWSPNGSYIVVQGPLNGRGELYFYDADNYQHLAFVEFRALHHEWDSSSRFFIAQADRTHVLDAVVRMWSPRGEQLIDVGPNLFCMRWCHKQSCAPENNSMLIDDDDGSLGGDTSGNRDGDPAPEKRPGDSVAEPSSKVPRLD